ncbi:MAG: DUF4347 domain-containing protein [Oculatellaceae cyanobacterium Prado106]|jgi:hypothetical protein|nr:DUF4347 domain-containing protein [Oculatellaceae cyanobacterium Prado106]
MISPAITALVFIDAAVADYQSLIDGLIPGTAAIVLEPDRDGVEQITEALTPYQNLKSLHLVSHGNPGNVQLGNATLNSMTIARYRSQLEQWRSALSENADLLIYGCNVAVGAVGKRFLHSLQQQIGVNLAAATTKVGHAKLGGRWCLDWHLGNVFSGFAFQPWTLAHYSGVLAPGDLTWDVTNTLPNNSPNITGAFGLEINGNFLYLTDSNGNNIDIYSIDPITGAIVYQSSFGSPGNGTDQFNFLVDLAFFTTSGGQTKAYVPDALNGRLVVLDVNPTTGALSWDTLNTLPLRAYF